MNPPQVHPQAPLVRPSNLSLMTTTFTFAPQDVSPSTVTSRCVGSNTSVRRAAMSALIFSPAMAIGR